ncbi:MAG: hydrogenase subunit MbhD domain-containing protein [Balneolaceae bacterium]
MIWEVELVLYLFLIFAAVVSIQAHDLLTAAVTLTIFSFTMALLFTTMGAVDVGFTEAVVGAGITGILLILALYHTTIRTKD